MVSFVVSVVEKLSSIPCLRSLCKYLLHLITGICELERICLDNLNGESYVQTFKALLRSLSSSKSPLMRSCIVETLDSPKVLASSVVDFKCKYKKNKEACEKIKLHVGFYYVLLIFFNNLVASRTIKNNVRSFMVLTPESDPDQYEKMLKSVWGYLVPTKPFPGTKSEEWKGLGFQGWDPSTDFRGLGMLAMYALDRLCSNQPSPVGKEGVQPTIRYFEWLISSPTDFSFAISFFNIIGMVMELLDDDYLVGLIHEQNCSEWESKKSLDFIIDFSISAFYGFCDFWIVTAPESILKFNKIKSAYKKEVILQLSSVS